MKTGNVKQIATFEQLLGFCNAHGAMYNPSKDSIKMTAMQSLLTSAYESLEAEKNAYTAYNTAVNERHNHFQMLPTFTTRIVNALAATEASDATLDDAYAYVKKFRWNMKITPATPSANGAIAMEADPPRSRSYSDFDLKADLFEGLVKVVSMEPSYAPNESDLQVASLQAFVKELRGLNTAVRDERVGLSNSRANRNKTLFSESGIHRVALCVKRYIKGAFGFGSTAYNQIKALKFITQK